MEHTSDLVAIGKFISEKTYSREAKNEVIEGKIAIDFVRKGNVLEVHEIKKSQKMERAHEMQALYYIYFLKKRGVKKLRAILDYPLLRKRKVIELTDENEKIVEKALKKIKEIISNSQPPNPRRVPYCKRCAYYEFCWCD